MRPARIIGHVSDPCAAYSVADHFPGTFDEAALEKWAAALRARLTGRVSLGLVFITPRLFPHAWEILEILRVHGQIPLLAGCSSQSLICNERELEDGAGLTLALYHLPGAQLLGTHFTQAHVEADDGPGYWQRVTGVTGERAERLGGWLVFADPYHLNAEEWLQQWNKAWAPLPVLGGLASAGPRATGTQVYLNGEVFETGGVGIAVGGDVALRGVISQGCTPIGQPWTITQVEQNVIRTIGNRPAYQVLVETFENLSDAEKQKTRSNLFVGLVINEHLEEFGCGDFLIRNLIGADPKTGVIAVGALPRVGQSLQFQRRDAQAAAGDLEALLAKAREAIADRPVYGACLCCCNGRGRNLFGAADHDAALVQQRLGPMGVAGFFCNGEIGPVGDRNFLHGYTASLALFVGRDTP